MANKLANASSPYLRQHADNPVDWYEWGDEAFEEARRRDVPVFLSVGYSSCHWCHVMAHESFEDDEVAAVLNDRFVPVKVDREERPDVDSVYMEAVQAMTGHGGWPMSVFLTPDGAPFFGGTYWPRENRQGMPGFLRVLDAVSDAWTGQRDQVVESGRRITAHIRSAQQVDAADGAVDPQLPEEAAVRCVQAWDTQHGGFGRAPKFPQAMTIDFLLAHFLRLRRLGDPRADGVLRAATHSLERMSRGGIYDHVAGGFARYSVDEVWLVPHFEKMLYDNALLLRAYTHAWQVTGEPRFRRVATETADYLLREMRQEAGGFSSATDADSEGIEGKFFVWSKAEFTEVVAATGEDPEEWAAFFGVTEEGNFSDPHHPEFGRHTILHEPRPRDERDEAFAGRLAKVRQALYDRRETRVHPGLDDKVLTSWNALALGALAEAGAVLDRGDYVDAARSCAAFLRGELLRGAPLHHTWKEGHGASVPAFLEDVAYLAQALLVLYEADPDPDWFNWARRLAADADARFADGDTGTYFSTSEDTGELPARPKDLWDNATPAGSSVMADVHLRLAAFTGNSEHADRAERILAALGPRARQAPTGFGELLRAAERLAAGPEEVAIVGTPTAEDTRALVGVYREGWRPGSVLAVGDSDGDTHAVPLLHGRARLDGRAAAYVCRNFACARPVAKPEALRQLLAGREGHAPE
ncbi:MAG TPA: thioredoxin domain-containing protein [Egibacteraceae bacterium]|nr:thioredoxin domain-containing protein [Egibacteraceae bacterium]